MDFVLRNGETRAIEFLIKSDGIGLHHERFETGAYQSLLLSRTYLVVDIKPWGSTPDMFNVPEQTQFAVATTCFLDPHVQKAQRYLRHAVFLVSDNLSSGILFTYEPNTKKAKVVQLSGSF